MHLFQRGDFTLSGGARSDFKIDCDALSDEDWDTLAYLAAKRLPKFGSVSGVPEGGLKFAKALEKYVSGYPDAGYLIADDVWTTGASMRRRKSFMSRRVRAGPRRRLGPRDVFDDLNRQSNSTVTNP